MLLRRVLKLSVALLFGVLLMAGADAAGAQSNPDYTAPPPSTTLTTPPPTTIVKLSQAKTSRSSLAITGSDVTQFAIVGGVLVAGGAAVLVARRRQQLS